MVREAGANKVYFASASPAVWYPNVYGIDMPSAKELVAHDRTEQEVADVIGADWLVYQEQDALVQCSAEGNSAIERFDCAVFDGVYVCGDVTKDYLDGLDAARNDTTQEQNREAAGGDSSVIGLHNEERN